MCMCIYIYTHKWMDVIIGPAFGSTKQLERVLAKLSVSVTTCPESLSALFQEYSASKPHPRPQTLNPKL